MMKEALFVGIGCCSPRLFGVTPFSLAMLIVS
jgi:hypothetical protein